MPRQPVPHTPHSRHTGIAPRTASAPRHRALDWVLGGRDLACGRGLGAWGCCALGALDVLCMLVLATGMIPRDRTPGLSRFAPLMDSLQDGGVIQMFCDGLLIDVRT
jgi:hypothetical protein